MTGSATVVNSESKSDVTQPGDQSTVQSVVILRGIAAMGVAVTHIQKYFDFHAGTWIDYIMNSGQQGVVVFFCNIGFYFAIRTLQKQL